MERSFSAEEDQLKCVECSLQPARVYTITGESGMLAPGRGSKESLELEVLKGTPHPSHPQILGQPSTSPSVSSTSSSSPIQRHHHHGNHHHGNHHHSNPHANATTSGGSQQAGPSSSSGSFISLSWCISDDSSWFPKENMFSFQTATTTMQAAFRGLVERKRRKRELQSASVIQRNFRKHLRMVGSRRMKAQTFAERRTKSFNRSWSDPTPVKPDTLHDSKDCGELQASSGPLDEASRGDTSWDEEREMERLTCEGDDFIPPKVMLISSKVPKAEYVPNIIRRDDPSIIPILYDHEHATFDDILEEIDKRLTAYRRGCKIWQMLIFCQGGPGHLYLLKNKVATFAKVEKEEDMSQFWKRLSRFMTKLNPEPTLIHVMGCYVLGNPNGEKLFQKLKSLMRPYSVEFRSPLELSSQGKEMIEMYFDFRLFRLWKTRQHSKLLDYEDI
uniref:NMDA receptor synaptonuclear signaling and neuronal migration factor a n=1 Tax=Denticeps clupeoides TaxID=299321 RepID=A0AAY4EK83_9TELE